MELLREISHWIADFADSDWASVILALTAFTEAIFNPFPPDPLLIGVSLKQPALSFWFAALTTVSSVAGAVLGHWLGLRFGKPLVLRFVSEAKFDKVEALFQKYGLWVVLIAAFTPIPYKVFAITAGVLELDRKRFIIVSLIGRGARFFLLGTLIFIFGESIQEFIDTQFELIMIGSAIVLVVGAVGVLFVMRYRSAKKAVTSG